MRALYIHGTNVVTNWDTVRFPSFAVRSLMLINSEDANTTETQTMWIDCDVGITQR